MLLDFMFVVGHSLQFKIKKLFRCKSISNPLIYASQKMRSRKSAGAVSHYLLNNSKAC